MKLYKLKFNTENKTIEDIRAEYTSNPPADEELKEYVKAYHNLHGVEFVGYKFEHMADSFGLNSWNSDDDHKFRDFIYQAEQDAFFGQYHNNREDFLKDWENEEYEPETSLHIGGSDVAIIEFIKKITI